MRVFLTILFGLAAYVCSRADQMEDPLVLVKDKNCLFVMDEHWRPAEKTSVQKLPSGFRLSGPEYRAHWTNRVVRFVCLKPGNIGSLGLVNWRVLEFDELGALLEHNELVARAEATPLRVLCLAPLRISFRVPRSPKKETVAELSYTNKQWKEHVKEEQAWVESVERANPTSPQIK